MSNTVLARTSIGTPFAATSLNGARQIDAKREVRAKSKNGETVIYVKNGKSAQDVLAKLGNRKAIARIKEKRDLAKTAFEAMVGATLNDEREVRFGGDRMTAGSLVKGIDQLQFLRIEQSVDALLANPDVAKLIEQTGSNAQALKQAVLAAAIMPSNAARASELPAEFAATFLCDELIKGKDLQQTAVVAQNIVLTETRHDGKPTLPQMVFSAILAKIGESPEGVAGFLAKAGETADGKANLAKALFRCSLALEKDFESLFRGNSALSRFLQALLKSELPKGENPIVKALKTMPEAKRSEWERAGEGDGFSPIEKAIEKMKVVAGYLVGLTDPTPLENRYPQGYLQILNAVSEECRTVPLPPLRSGATQGTYIDLKDTEVVDGARKKIMDLVLKDLVLRSVGPAFVEKDPDHPLSAEEQKLMMAMGKSAVSSAAQSRGKPESLEPLFDRLLSKVESQPH